ncbi:MAG: SWIM zinc finger family protein, partial [Azonexus sp.]
MPPISLESCTEKHLHAWLGQRELDKARDYVDRVQDIEIEPDFIRAVVPGSARKPYLAIAKLVAGKQGTQILVSTCTCPVGGHCKHVAAMLLRAIEERATPDRVSPGVLSWVEDLRRASIAVAKKKARPAGARQQLFYMLKWTADQRQFGIEIAKGKFPDGAEEWWNVERALINPPQFVSEEDLGILRLLWADRLHETGLRAFGLGPKHGAEVLERLVQSGRFYPDSGDDLPLAAGEPRPATVGWRVDARGLQRPLLLALPAAPLIVPVQPPWYVDLAEGEAGPLEVTGNPAVINRLFSLPPLSAKEAAVVAKTLAELAPELPQPSEDATVRLRVVDAPLRPILMLDTIPTHGNRAWRGYAGSFAGDFFDVARPVFRYADVDVRPDEHHEFVTLPEGETVQLKRHPGAEIAALQALTAAGFEKIPSHTLDTFGRPPDGVFGLASERAWAAFMEHGREALRGAGWQIEYPEDFRHHLLSVDGWEADLVESDNGWFDLDMGIIVDGERMALA